MPRLYAVRAPADYARAHERQTPTPGSAPAVHFARPAPFAIPLREASPRCLQNAEYLPSQFVTDRLPEIFTPLTAIFPACLRLSSA